ncbi:hypothetical protein SELMODRAFT_272089 [Selaginella moellendorffii]|uniref:CASP-like protein 2U6 n=1 Tax=Selaginella moellendorffii TaxID=88036 RepID=CSPL1_SELML|nr:CASP-like protein 2U6 [Selaginella moellendorffii]D8T2C0.1 RecName: Full=CASP-like protein 2U6; Short=SmCASPL2U6 [Selaginella moellendorffii]EFJ09182.1 hypothetical protein SELMODRAFT_272089 [Selaginella moellendorffii]|eukprot:XP_002989705.1 CASP-like protein 2U6 [Selaginella moellendorffii]
MSEHRIPVAADKKISPPISAGEQKGCKGLKRTDLMLRFAAFVCCTVTMVVLITDKQTSAIQVPGFNNLTITKTVSFDLAKAFVYLVSAAGIGAGYTLLVLVLSIISAERSKAIAWFIFVFDQLITYVLLAAAAASTEVAYMGAHAPPEASWLKVCSLFGRFCHQLGASLVTSLISTVLFAFSAAISAYYLFSNTNVRPAYSKG